MLSCPIVNDQGVLTGAEVTFRLADVCAIEHMSRWVRTPRTLDETLANPRAFDDERYELVPECLTISLGRCEFNIKTDYAQLKQQMIALNEWDRTP